MQLGVKKIGELVDAELKAEYEAKKESLKEQRRMRRAMGQGRNYNQM